MKAYPNQGNFGILSNLDFISFNAFSILRIKLKQLAADKTLSNNLHLKKRAQIVGGLRIKLKQFAADKTKSNVSLHEETNSNISYLVR